MRKFIRAACVAAVALGVAGGAQAAVLNFSVGDVTSGSFGDAHIAAGNITDTLAFTLTTGGLFSASLTNAATRLGQPGDLDFTSVILTGSGGPYNFTIRNNDNADGLTDSAVWTGSLAAGSYLLTIAAHSFGNAQFGANTTLDTSAVPEPANWALMLGGFGLMGAVMRQRRNKVSFA